MTDDLLKAALHRHCDDDPPRLDFSVPLDRLLDDAHCRALSDDLAAAASDGWELVKATQAAWQRIPAKPGLYMFVWQPRFDIHVATNDRGATSFSWILYVGRAGDSTNTHTLKTRYRQEYAKLVQADPECLWAAEPATTRSERLSRYLSMTPLSFWYCVIEDSALIPKLERRLFALFAPPLNTSGSRRLRPVGKPHKAF